MTRTPGPQSRQISPDHARVIAGTGGVIGVWPPSSIFIDFKAFIEGFARMADVVGVDHVGLGSDMMGLTTPSVFLDGNTWTMYYAGFDTTGQFLTGLARAPQR